jgi:hypothetical protein
MFCQSTTWAMNPMLPKITRFVSLNLLSWINLLSAGSVTMFWVLGGSGIKPVHADFPDRQAAPLESNQAAQTTDGEELQYRESEASSTTQEQAQSAREATAKLLPTEEAVTPAAQTPRQSTKLLNEPSSVWQPQHQTASPIDARSLFTLSSTLPELQAQKTPTPQGDATLTPTPARQFSSVSGGTTINQERSLNKMEEAQPSKQESIAIKQSDRKSPSRGERDRSNTNLAQLPTLPQPPSVLPVPATPIPVTSKGAQPAVEQFPSPPQPSNFLPIAGSPNPYNSTVGQLPYIPQPQYPVPATGVPMSPSPYGNMGQYPYYPQAVLLVPVPATGLPMSPNPYGGMGQYPYYPQPVLLVPVPAMGMPMSPNPYNPTMGQFPYYPQNVAPSPAPVYPNPVGSNYYNPGFGQSAYYPQPTLPQAVAPSGLPMGSNSYPPYYPQNVPPLPAPLAPNPASFNSYNPNVGQPGYYPQNVPPLPAPLSPNAGVPNSYNPSFGQPLYYPQPAPPLPIPLNQSPVIPNSNTPTFGQYPYSPQPLPSAPTPTAPFATTPSIPQPTLERNTAVTPPFLRIQGVYINQGDISGARARVYGLYPLNSRVQFGGALDLVTGENLFTDSRRQGLNLNELYVAVAPFENLPNFRLIAGQLDLTSYFDRNSFAKDGASHFFNPVFQTNPALSAAGIASRPGVVVNWTVTDNIEAKAAVFSSARDFGDFSLDGFAGEIGIRQGNAIIRGTYASDRDAGSRDSFREIFGLQRDGGTGIRSSDREQAYGVNFEYYFPQINMGVFARYGRYDNRTIGRGGDTYSAGISFLDVFTPNDRLGLAYGRALSNDRLRRERGDEVPDVLEVFYDFKFLPNFRLGFTLQQRNGFSDTYAGFRVKTEFDVTPAGRLAP